MWEKLSHHCSHVLSETGDATPTYSKSNIFSLLKEYTYNRAIWSHCTLTIFRFFEVKQQLKMSTGPLNILMKTNTDNQFVSPVAALKGHSHYCIFRVRLRQMVAFQQGDRKFPISALMQPTAENADCCV